jgi:hypothetical protein
MPMPLPIAFFGLFAGLWKLAAIVLGLTLLLWRKGLWRHPLFRLLLPWARTSLATPAAGTTPKAAPRRRGFWARVLSDRWYLALLIAAGSTIVLWALARFTIHQSVSPGN